MLGMHARYSYAGFVIENLLKYTRPAQIILKQDQYQLLFKIPQLYRYRKLYD